MSPSSTCCRLLVASRTETKTPAREQEQEHEEDFWESQRAAPVTVNERNHEESTKSCLSDDCQHLNCFFPSLVAHVNCGADKQVKSVPVKSRRGSFWPSNHDQACLPVSPLNGAPLCWLPAPVLGSLLITSYFTKEAFLLLSLNSIIEIGLFIIPPFPASLSVVDKVEKVLPISFWARSGFVLFVLRLRLFLSAKVDRGWRALRARRPRAVLSVTCSMVGFSASWHSKTCSEKKRKEKNETREADKNQVKWSAS